MNFHSDEEKTLICFIGTLRALDITHKSLIEKLIKPLNADLMICVTKLNSDDEELLKYFKDINIIDSCLYETISKTYEDYCDQYVVEKNLKNSWRDYLKIEGNWIGGLNGVRGSGMHLTFNYWKLLERIKRLEFKNYKYQRYIITRTDFLWLFEHPPLGLLNPTYIWIPEGEDHDGYNDRHAVCSRTNIDSYLNCFQFMMDMTAMKYARHEINFNHERFLQNHLDYHRVKVARFKNSAYITGNKNTHNNWIFAITSKRIGNEEYHFKYFEEVASAVQNFSAFKDHGDWNRMIYQRGVSEELKDLVRFLRIFIVNRTSLYVMARAWKAKLLKYVFFIT